MEKEVSKSEAEEITAQYDSIMSMIPSQTDRDETNESNSYNRGHEHEIPAQFEKSEEAPAQISEEKEAAPAQTEEAEESAPVQTEESTPVQTEEKEAAPVQSEVSPAQIELSSLENARLEASRNPDSGRTEEEEEQARALKKTEEESSPIDEEDEAIETEASEENPLGIDPERLPYIWGNKTHLAGTDAWKLGPFGSELKYLEETLRATMLPYVTHKPANFAEESCDGRRVYVYDLPPEYNQDLVGMCGTLFPWFSLCPYVADSGQGVPVNAVDNGTQILVPGDRWFNTHQYALEMLSHARILKYKCRTEDREKANLFYIPFYAGLDVIRWHFYPNTTNEKRDALSLKLMSWLGQQAEYRRHAGKDHVLVLGKISWDFRRQPAATWGSRMLMFPELKEVTRLMIERDPWTERDVGVPHPTYFHPQSASDIDTWLAHVRSQKRTHLVTFVGKERKNDPTNPRTALVRQCLNVTRSIDCKFVECNKDLCLHPAFVTRAFLGTHFCMQPPGDSPSRRSVFDSLIAGCIPVLFHPQTAYIQYPWHLPRNESTWSVYVDQDEVIKGTVNVVDELKKISFEQRTAMRELIINTVIPGLLYSAPGSDVSPYRDAFDITLDQLLHQVKVRLGSDQSD